MRKNDDQYDTQYVIDNILKMDVSHKRLMYYSYIKSSPFKEITLVSGQPNLRHTLTCQEKNHR